MPILGKFRPKCQTCPFKVTLDRWSNSNMQNSVTLFTFFIFDWKYPFCANLVQNVKIVSLSWNLVPRLVRIWKIQSWCSLFLFLIGNTLLGENFVQKVKIVSLKSDSHLPSKKMLLLHWKPFKYEKNAFFHFKSSFRSQDI